MVRIREPIGAAEYLRRRASSAMIDALCQVSPAQAAFREAGREHDALTGRLLEVAAAGYDLESIDDELAACGERLAALAELIDCQWGAPFDRSPSRHR